jgi:hypothetical protein
MDVGEIEVGDRVIITDKLITGKVESVEVRRDGVAEYHIRRDLPGGMAIAIRENLEKIVE